MRIQELYQDMTDADESWREPQCDEDMEDGRGPVAIVAPVTDAEPASW